MVLIVTGLLAVVGPLLIILGSAITVVSALAGAISLVTGVTWGFTAALLANPITGIIALVVGAIFAFRMLAKEIFGTESVVFKFFDAIWQGWKAIGKFIFGTIFKVIGAIGKFLGLKALSGLKSLTSPSENRYSMRELDRPTVSAEQLSNVKSGGQEKLITENRLIIDASNLPPGMVVKPAGRVEGSLEIDRGGMLAY